ANYQGNILLQLADMGRKDGWTNYISAPFVADNQWHHVAVTVNRDEANGIRWYLDGSEVGTPANPTGRSGSLDNPQPLVIGKRSDHSSSPGFFSGEMADIKLFNTSLTPQQIESLANDPSF
ncbi:MAG: LamG domain-containing protein, partial [Cyanobacteria bacterium J06659_2]